MHWMKCDSSAAATALGERNVSPNGSTAGDDTILSAGGQERAAEAPPRAADLISLMREKFSTAIPGEEEEEEGEGGGVSAAGQSAAGSTYDYGNKQGTAALLHSPFLPGLRICVLFLRLRILQLKLLRI